MGNQKPAVSIGLPVYNGARYLHETVDAILAQTFSDFELVISDNTSTDLTEQICREYAKNDPRVQYYRKEVNLGATRNHNRVFELARGKYFKWSSHDDVLAPEFLSKCVTVLNQDASIVLCHSKILRINEYGTVTGTDDSKTLGDLPKTHIRFGDLIRFGIPTTNIFGVIRRSTLQKTALFGHYIGTDRNLLAEISLFGRIYIILEYLFRKRIHSQRYSHKYFAKQFPDYEAALAWWTTGGKVGLPYVKRIYEYFKSVKRAPQKRKEQMLCYAQILKLLCKTVWRRIGRDVKTFLYYRQLKKRCT